MSRPPFEPKPGRLDSDTFTLGLEWVPVLECAAPYPLEIFSSTLLDIIHHPERNSTFILRADILSDKSAEEEPILASVSGYKATRQIRRRILPRSPKRDGPLEQDCIFFTPVTGDDLYHDLSSLVVLTPRLDDSETLPFYHPAVRQLAFRYLTTPEPILRIDIIPINPETNTSSDTNSRLHRTCLALLETVHRFGWGQHTGYKKRVLHDTLVSREEYQDLYLVVKDRFEKIAQDWQESTDPQKHVFEDIGISTFLMLLWKSTYKSSPSTSATNDNEHDWTRWPRPPNGFVDVGCGNGLLVHILISLGYDGVGFDLRSRKSWAHYSVETQQHLRVLALDPTEPLDDTIFKGDQFLIGNHADEMQPWLPVIAVVTNSKFLSMPCCAWDFDTRFQRKKKTSKEKEQETALASKLRMEDGIKKSTYGAYLIWLARMAEDFGFDVEFEALRIPSTRNWAIIGRTSRDDVKADEVRDSVQKVVEGVKLRGQFKTRVPEGSKDH